MNFSSPKVKYFLLLIPTVVLAAGLVYGWQLYQAQSEELVATQTDLASTTTTFLWQVKNLTNELEVAQEENDDLSEELRGEKDRNNEFQDKIDDITGTVDDLVKIKAVDTELLQKYSKIYFLNEHYTPKTLVEIPVENLHETDRSQKFHGQVWSRLERLLEDAVEDDIKLQIVSAYRSFGEQTVLKSSYKVTYGAGTANQFSADQGYSEHQLGTTIDFTSPGVSAILTGFETSEAYTWLTKNAYRHGFILSYPAGNIYYQFEPWHWRYVGTKLARKLHREKKNFYDLDQREIDQYRIDFFD